MGEPLCMRLLGTETWHCRNGAADKAIQMVLKRKHIHRYAGQCHAILIKAGSGIKKSIRVMEKPHFIIANHKNQNKFLP